MTPLIIIAEEGELELVRKLFPLSEVLQTGVGALNIYLSLKDLPRDREIVNIGYAGSANFEIGSWVRVTEARLHHPNVSYQEPKLTLRGDSKPTVDSDMSFIEAPCYTNVDFVLSSPYKDCVFDMELAFIMAMGFENVTAYKYVSDNLSLHTYREVYHQEADK